MIYDKPFTNASRVWLREIADMEHEDSCDDTYQASLIAPATAVKTPPLKPPAVLAREEAERAAAKADPLHAATGPVRDGQDEEVLGISAEAMARMAICGSCE